MSDQANQVEWIKGRDKYGRTTYTGRRNFKSIGRIVLLPKEAAEYHGGCRYLANDWTAERTYPATDTSGYVSHHANLKIAKGHLVSVAR